MKLLYFYNNANDKDLIAEAGFVQYLKKIDHTTKKPMQLKALTDNWNWKSININNNKLEFARS